MNKMSNSILKVMIIVIFTITVLSFPAYCQDFIFSPAADEMIQNNRPLIRASFSPETVNSSSIRIFVNDKDVTPSAIKTNSFIMYNPLSPLPEGRNEVRLRYTDTGEKSWEFYVDTMNLIYSVKHDASEVLVTADEIIITMEGRTGARAWFSIENIIYDIPMEENRVWCIHGQVHRFQGGLR
jgi:hypothetical protein